MTVEPIQLTLYGKPDCGLCDELKAMLAELQSESRFVLREQNILEDPAAYERYRSWVPVLEIEGGLLTGQVLGDIVDGAAKQQHLLALCQRLGCDPRQSIAVGDGANDLPMMGVSGLSVAYHAKPKVREQAMVSIQAGGLDRVLELFS